MDCPNLNSKGEDNRLNNWKKWVGIRKQFHQRMYEIQHRTPSELALNATEDYRTIKEEQLLHEYAKIPEIFTDRGKPSFWTLPPGSRKFPSLLSVMPKALDCEVPERIIAGVPTLIQREKNILTGENRKYSKWFKNEYLLKRNKQLENKFKRIVPPTPDIEDLIITGTSHPTVIDKNEVKLEDLDEQITQEARKSSVNNLAEEAPLKSLQIENATFTADGCQEIKKYLVFIDYEIGKDDIVNKSISLKNVGNVALRYHWYRHLPKKVLQDIIPSRLPVFSFIFTKNECIILPNQSKELKIAFKTNSAGLYKEMWELRTEPSVFNGDMFKGEFFLVLHACAEMANFAASEAAILNRLEEGMKYTAVEDTILNILQRTQNITAEQMQRGHRITEKDLFEAANAKFGSPGTLPSIYYYNEEVVKKLKYMYDALKTEADPPIWNYKIDDVDKLIINCETKEEQNFYKFSFDELVRKIFKSSMILNEERAKYQNIYVLLCVMVDQMSEKICALRDKHKIPLIETYPAVTEETLMQQEYLDDNCRSNLYFPDITAQIAVERIKECKTDTFEKPPMEVLKLLPFEDIEQRYKVYQMEKYGIDVDKLKQEAGKKGKKGKDKGKDKKGKDKKGKDKDKKGKDKGGKEGKGKETKKTFTLRKESVVREQSLTQLLTDKVEIFPEYLAGEDYEEPSEDSLRVYYYNLYITIYLLLCETANEIECILEHMKSTKRISRDVLRKCLEFGIPTMPLPTEKKVSRSEFKTMLHDIEDISSASQSYASFVQSSKIGLLSDISKSYSDYDNEFFQPISSVLNFETEKVEMVDAQTETDGEELFPPKTRIGNIETDEDREEFDLVAQVEKELSSTSVQYFKKPMEDKCTQVESTECVLEEYDYLIMSEG